MTTASDNFNRANGALGSDWASFFGATTIASNAVTGTVGLVCASRWVAASFGPDQTSTATIVSFTSSTSYPGVAVRMDASGDCYAVAIDSSNAYIERVSGGTEINLLTVSAGAWAPGDIVSLSIVGTTLQVLKNGAPYGASTTDATLATGEPGLLLFGTNVMDDWSATDGAAVEPSTIAWITA